MKKYVFLTEILSGLTGTPRYVNNKSKLLREDGWDVVVFWNYNIAPVDLEHIKCFDREEYIHHELKFYPSWFSERERNNVINQLVTVIGEADQIIVESNKLELGAWGELLAKRLHCKHFVFVVTEEIMIHNKDTFDFCYAKMKKDEFFTITESAVKYLFSNFTTIEHPERYFWSAIQGVEVKDYIFPVFDELPQADYTITSFGRRKDYFPYMLAELKLFVSQYPNKRFNLFFIGDMNDSSDIRESLSLDNAHLVIYPHAVEIVPKQIFTQSDVVVGTAGCAWLSANNGCKTISMDVNRNVPLGLLRYTTLESNTYSGQYSNNKSLSGWLKSLLIDKDEYTPMEAQRVYHTFEYQMKDVDKCDYYYFDSRRVEEKMTQHDVLLKVLVKIGLFRVVEYLYYKKRGVKSTKRLQ